MPNPQDYTVGWICAIDTEYVAAIAFLDEKHDEPERVSTNDNNAYTLGRFGKHNVVIAVAPDGEYGTQSAATVARDMMHSFPNVRIGLMVGIAGGVPSSKHDIRLGDVVVSAPRDGKGGVFQYDYGKQRQEQDFQPTGFLNQPPPLLRTAVVKLRARYESDGHELPEAINAVLGKKPRLRKKYKRPDLVSDRLYLSTFVHPIGSEEDCGEVCGQNSANLVIRTERTDEDDDPTIHYGLIASGNRVMKDAIDRDLAARQGVLCFEMEAAGLMNHFPCLVIRGICDYSDSHKNKAWQGYAAMVAAAYAKDLLRQIAPNNVEAERPIIQSLNDIHGSLRQILQDRRSQKEDDILQWLSPIDYHSQQNDSFGRRHPGTGQWLLKTDEYLTWRDTIRGTLFCYGIPGAGKTILTSIIVDDLVTRYNKDDASLVAFIYCDYRQQGEQGTQKVDDILSSLLKQLLQKCSSLPTFVLELHRSCLTRQTRPSREDLGKALQNVMISASKTFVIIDALDELSDDCRHKLLSEIFKIQSRNDLSLLMTARPTLNKEKDFQQCEKFGCLEIRATDEDVEDFLDGHISEMRVNVSIDFRSEIKRTISAAAEGMFLLAQLYCGMLKDKTTVRNIKNLLVDVTEKSQRASRDSNSHEALTQAYEHTMARISGQASDPRELATQTLSLLSCAERPLHISELRNALAVVTNHFHLDADNIPDVGTILAVCHGLIALDEESEIVRLIHYTTQQYFDDHPHILLGSHGRDSQTYIAETCITYLCFEDLQDSRLTMSFNGNSEGFEDSYRTVMEQWNRYPFYDYAVNYWGNHLRRSSSEMLTKIPPFLQTTGEIEQKYQPAAMYSHAEKESGRTAAHLAAYFGLVEILLALLREGHGVDDPDDDGWTPLLFASSMGHEPVVRLLLAKGAAPDSRASAITPLLVATENCRDRTVELLIEAGADINRQNITGWTALALAAANGEDPIARILLEAHAGLEISDRANRTALSKVSTEAVARLLIAKGANVHAVDSSGRTPLMWACQDGRPTVAKVLIAHGADLNGYDNYSHNPMSLAAMAGHLEIVEILSEAGADVTGRGNKDHATPLGIAAQFQHEDVGLFLVSRGVDVNSSDDHKCAPLHRASKGSLLMLARCLVENGADMNLRTDRGFTPLMVALDDGNEEMVELLVEMGACINGNDADGDDGLTPLDMAVMSVEDTIGNNTSDDPTQARHKEIVRLLINHGAKQSVHERHSSWEPYDLALDFARLTLMDSLYRERDITTSEPDDVTAAQIKMGTYMYEFDQLDELHLDEVNKRMPSMDNLKQELSEEMKSFLAIPREVRFLK